MKLLMLGGSFNPPHLGHLYIANTVRKKFAYDKVVFVPSFIPAHKEVASAVNSRQRLDMITLAAGELDNAFVCDCEYKREGISYSYDTIQYLKNEYTRGEKPGLIIGDDLVSGFQHWHRAEELSREADIIICHRGFPSELPFPFPHRYISNIIFSISSTDLRDKLSRQQDPGIMLPESVFDYIRQEGLYGF